MTENQNKVIELVKQTKPLIFQEMTHEKVTEKGAADYVTNVDTEVTVFQKSKKIAIINNSSEAQYTEVYINGNCVYKLDMEPGEMRWVDDVE